MRHFFTTFLLLLSGAIAVAQPEVGRFSITPKIGGSMCTMTGDPDVRACIAVDVEYWPSYSRYNVFEGPLYGHSRMRLGWQGGVDVQYQFTRRSGITMGIGYSAQGMSVKRNTVQVLSSSLDWESAIFYYDNGQFVAYNPNGPYHYCEFKNMLMTLGYLNIPVMYNFYIGKGFSANVGLQLGVNVTRKVSYDALYDTSAKDTHFMSSHLGQPQASFQWEFEGKKRMVYIDWRSLGSDQIRKVVLAAPVSLSYEWHQWVADLRYCIDLTEATRWRRTHETDVKIWSEPAHSRNSVLSLTIGYRFQL